MATQEVAIKQTVNITLKSDAEVLEEVVVTGYGVQRKASFTGAAAIIGEDVIAKKSDANFVKALEGAVPGVQMSNSTSMPGVWSEIYVRGRGSLNSGTQPLYVIDGMPVNSETDGMSTTTNNNFDPMAAINPSDIESVTVLKDAAATAIYGSRAANGVIVITTKKGKEGKMSINLDIKQGFVSMGNHNMDYANAQESMNLFAHGRSVAYGNTYDESYDYLKKVYQGYGWDGVSSYDWMDAITRKGYYQDTINYTYNILNQKNINVDVLIVDNDSQNSSFENLSKEFVNNSRVRVIESEKNGGYAYGNNFGLKYIEKEDYNYIVISNNDIIIDDELLLYKLTERYSSLHKPAFLSPVQTNKGLPYLLQMQTKK
jgi:TonB-dependent SusC/RagA subfamily outer membrane receptor